MVSLNPNGGVKHSVAYPCRWPKFNHCVRLTALKAICNGQAGIFLFSMEVVARVVRGFWAKLESLRTKIMEFSCFFFGQTLKFPAAGIKSGSLRYSPANYHSWVENLHFQ